VNLSLPWLAWQGRTGGRNLVRMTDRLLPAVAIVLCVWLLLHAGWVSIAVGVGLTVMGLAVSVGRRS